MSDPLFLRSGHDQVTIFLLTSTKTKVILCSDKRGQGPEAQLSPSEVQALAKRRGSLHQPVTLPRSISPAPSLSLPASAQAQLKRQISAAGALRGRSPDPAEPLSLREPGAQDPAGPQAFHLN